MFVALAGWTSRVREEAAMGPEQASQSGGSCVTPGVLSTFILMHTLASTLPCSQVASGTQLCAHETTGNEKTYHLSRDSVLDGTCTALSNMYRVKLLQYVLKASVDAAA